MFNYQKFKRIIFEIKTASVEFYKKYYSHRLCLKSSSVKNLTR